MDLNVLIADDSIVMRTIILKTLRLSGVPLLEVFTADRGDEALRIVVEKHIDVAFVDLHMPVLSGEEVINRIRENPKTANLPIIVVSAEGNEARIDSLRRMGVGFIHKPFMPEALRDEILRLTRIPNGETDAPGAVSSNRAAS